MSNLAGRGRFVYTPWSPYSACLFPEQLWRGVGCEAHDHVKFCHWDALQDTLPQLLTCIQHPSTPFTSFALDQQRPFLDLSGFDS